MTARLIVSKHPLVLDKITRMRDKKTRSEEFRRLAGEVAMLVGYEALSLVKVRARKVKTPLADAQGARVSGDITFVTILRAGLAMTDGLRQLEPCARFAHIGVYRNESTLEPVRYYARFPKDIAGHFVLLADPMLATGGSAVESLSILKSQGAKNIAFMCIIAAEQGIKRVHQYHPDVPIFAGIVDAKLNSKGYIVPGLGDAGDRMFGTV